MATGILQLLFDVGLSPVVTTDVTQYLHKENPVHYSKSTNQRWNCTFTLIDKSYTGAHRPIVGQSFRLLEDGDIRFSGFIDQIDETALPGTRVLLYACTCSNWASLCDRRVVTKTYQQNTLALTVIADIVATNLAGDGITQVHVVAAGTLNAPLALEPISVAQAFDTIRDITDEEWWIDDNKDLHFSTVNSGSSLAWSLTDPGGGAQVEWLAGSMKITRTTKDYRNVQYVSSSALGQPPPSQQSSGGGSAAQQYVTLTDSYVTTASGYDFFIITSQPVQLDPANPVPPTVSVNGVNQTIKAYFTDAFGQNAWYYTVNGIGVQQGQQIAPSVGSTVVITYQAFAGGGGILAPVDGGGTNAPAVSTQDWVVQQNNTEIAARAAIEGDNGRWENVTSVPGITDPTVAGALAAGLLARSGTIPDVLMYQTWRSGYEVGAKIVANIPYHGVNGTYTVQQIDAQEEVGAGGRSPISGKTLLYTITLSNQQNIGDYVKWMQGLVRSIGAGQGGGSGVVPSTDAASPGMQIIREAPTGTKNGSNTVFTLSFKPQPPWAVWLSLNGVLQSELDGDYSLSSSTITFAVAPVASDQMYVIYLIANPGLAPQTVQSAVYSTGSYIEDGGIDPHWVLALSPDTSNLGPLAYIVNAPLNVNWVANPTGAKWISPWAAGKPGPVPTAGLYKYTLTFNLPAATGSITGFATADDSLVLKFNGNTILTVGTGASTTLHAFTISSGFIAGTNVLTMEVTELGFVVTGCLVQITQATSP